MNWTISKFFLPCSFEAQSDLGWSLQYILKMKWRLWLPSRASQIPHPVEVQRTLPPCPLPTYLPPFLLQKVQAKTFGRGSWRLHKGKKCSSDFDYPKTDPFTGTPCHSPGRPLRSQRWARHRLTIILWTFLFSTVKSESQYLCFVLSRAVMTLKWDNVCKELCKL